MKIFLFPSIFPQNTQVKADFDEDELGKVVTLEICILKLKYETKQMREIQTSKTKLKLWNQA